VFIIIDFVPTAHSPIFIIEGRTIFKL